MSLERELGHYLTVIGQRPSRCAFPQARQKPVVVSCSSAQTIASKIEGEPWHKRPFDLAWIDLWTFRSRLGDPEHSWY
jgi:hypothetical protein